MVDKRRLVATVGTPVMKVCPASVTTVKPAGKPGTDAIHPGATNEPEVAAIDSGASTNKYGGKMVGENSWVFNRQRLLDYYQELRDEPERLVKVFDSLKPLYTPDRRITGYHLGIEGEADFFEAAGMKEGDIVRAVNDVPMTNRRRAEHMISQFVTDQANAFVIEIERNGAPARLVYEVR